MRSGSQKGSGSWRDLDFLWDPDHSLKDLYPKMSKRSWSQELDRPTSRHQRDALHKRARERLQILAAKITSSSYFFIAKNPLHVRNEACDFKSKNIRHWQFCYPTVFVSQHVWWCGTSKSETLIFSIVTARGSNSMNRRHRLPNTRGKMSA